MPGSLQDLLPGVDCQLCGGHWSPGSDCGEDVTISDGVAKTAKRAACSRRGEGGECNMGVSENSVPHCTQWFCWSLSLWKMAISLGRLTQHFQTNPHQNDWNHGRAERKNHFLLPGPWVACRQRAQGLQPGSCDREICWIFMDFLLFPELQNGTSQWSTWRSWYLGKFHHDRTLFSLESWWMYREIIPFYGLSDFMVSKGNHPRMAARFRLVKYCNLPSWYQWSTWISWYPIFCMAILDCHLPATGCLGQLPSSVAGPLWHGGQHSARVDPSLWGRFRLFSVQDVVAFSLKIWCEYDVNSIYIYILWYPNFLEATIRSIN